MQELPVLWCTCESLFIKNFFKVLILFQSFNLWLVNLIIIHVDNLQQHKRDCIFYFLLMASICKPKCHWTSMIIIFAVNFELKFTSTDSEIFIRYIHFVNVFCVLFSFFFGGGDINDFNLHFSENIQGQKNWQPVFKHHYLI